MASGPGGDDRDLPAPDIELVVRQLERMDRKYRRRGQLHSAVTGGLLVRIGPQPVMVTAPHAVPTRRDGRHKPGEVYAGAWAELIAEAVDCSVLTVLRSAPDAPSAESTIRPALEIMLQARPPVLLLDIHGMGPRHKLDACLGSGPAGQSRRPALLLMDLLSEHFAVAVDSPFRGAGDTLCGWVAGRFPDCEVCQVELGPRLRSNASREEDVVIALDAIAAVVRAFG